ncbi:MAG: Xanthine dehydrogenase family protein molybdopterin-binding subunit [Deltaproteobacteria bacterium]|nr:Xanthine dehydrogenase family protein molybdopterin-binding subunit [Deltaproteobacteria bacterium]
MPRIETTLVDDCCGVGEIACVPPMACIAHATFNTLGGQIAKLWVSAENIFRALTEKVKSVKVDPAPGTIRQSPLVKSRSTN